MLLILTLDNRCLNEIHTIIVGWIDIWTNKKPIKTPLAISQCVLKNAKNSATSNVLCIWIDALLGNLWPQRLKIRPDLKQKILKNACNIIKQTV